MNSEPIWAVGLMTGTALDGNIDVAMLKTDGVTITEFGPYALAPYDPEIMPLLRQAQQDAIGWDFTGPEPAIFAEAEAAFTPQQARAVRDLVESAGMTMADIGVVGFHGHTVLHRGRIVEEGPGRRVLGDPQHPYTRRLLAALPVPDPAEQAVRRGAWRALSHEEDAL